MENDFCPQSTRRGKPNRNSLLDRLLCPSLGKRLGIAFVLFLALTAGNLFIVERLHDGIASMTTLVNDSGRLRYLSQEIAFHSVRLAYENRQDGESLGQLRAKFEEKLGKVELAVRQLPPIVGEELIHSPGLFWDLKEAWLGYRAVVDLIRNRPGEVDVAVAFGRLGLHSAAMLEIADAVVNELERASSKAHAKVDFILHVILASEVAFVLGLFFYLRRKVFLPVREISRLVSRFAAGDRSARIDFTSRDEIGALGREFNQTADKVAHLIADLDAGLKVNTALHRAARILQDERRPVAEVMQELVLMLPSAFQCPEKVAVRIVYEDEPFVTPDFSEAPLRLSESFAGSRAERNFVEVFLADEISAGVEPFLEGERELVQSLAEMLRSYQGRSLAQLSRARLAAILETTTDYVSTATPEGKLMYVNRAGCELLGLDEKDILDHDMARCHPAWANSVIQNVGLPTAMRDGAWSGESALLSGDGREIPISQVIVAHKNERGETGFFSCLARDISDRIGIESRLTQSRDFFLGMFHDFPHMIWRCGSDGKFNYLNKTWLDFTGRNLELELGDGWVMGIHPDDREGYVKSFMAALHECRAFEIEFRMRRHDGEFRWIVDNGAPFKDVDGKFAGFIGACYDVTERKLALEKVAKLSLVVEAMAASVVITDPHAVIEYVNPYFSRLTGYSFEEAVGQTPSLFKSGMTPPDCYQNLWNTLKAGKEWRGELLNRKKDGELFWESEVISVLKSPAGEVTHFIAVKDDITERKNQEEKLRLWGRAIESSVNAVVIADTQAPGNPLIYVNPAFERITGYSKAEALGRNAKFLQKDDQDQPDIKELCQALREQREGRAVLRNYRKDGSMFWNELLIAPVRDESGKTTHYVGIQNDITERKDYETQLERQANYDALTELPNRNLSLDRLGQAMSFARRHGRGFALMFLDLDFFKNINDSLGHDIGDLLLKQVGARLAGCVREGDTVARQGGDEFLVILADLAEEEDVTVVSRKIILAMASPYEVGGHELYVTVSIGIALFPRDGEDQQTLLKNADSALYRAKDLGRNTSQFFAAEMNLKARERLLLEYGMRHALERNEFVLHYQPRVDLRTGEIVGTEALVRWQHPELGLMPPGRFIPVAEESGIIVPLGAWVLRAACAQNKTWQLAGLRPVCVSVNLSAHQFRQSDLVELVASILKETDLDPAFLELELTESLIMQNVEATIDALTRLKAMGVKFSIDDFGTGYSSLSYLKRFPIDALKIDQSFVRDITTDPDDAAIAKTVISMAHDLQLKVIAEGVETEAQKSFLRLRSCDEMQGYLFSKPVPPGEFETLLREPRRLSMEGTVAALGQRTLLLLDDEENILTSLARLLRRDGYKILKATSAAKAFELLAEHPVGVIVSDQRMPEMNGTEFLRRVKRIYPDTVRMVLSGYTDLKSVTDAINEGAVYRFLTKPWDDDMLRANIQEAFQRHEAVLDYQRLNEEMIRVNEELNRTQRELEKHVEQKTGEVEDAIGLLRVSQEVLGYLPVGVIGVGEDGLIAVANGTANELLDAGDKQPLVGCYALERLPPALTECLSEPGKRGSTKLGNGREVKFWSHVMGVSSGARGTVLVIVPDEKGGV